MSANIGYRSVGVNLNEPEVSFIAPSLSKGGLYHGNAKTTVPDMGEYIRKYFDDAIFERVYTLKLEPFKWAYIDSVDRLC